ncbi:MAG TPA: ABC transporter ATP-binding protein [Thermoclostridium sp.]|nr:ABC transporter ATP-binding protein [Clostridiaceae bacterium]HOQ76016.1 ABC transporter ATP-binding protein [Thermoclostridium sp.]HPU45699.1 ABC transporter ATP-binding protein [Thermoclostridium sp.]
MEQIVAENVTKHYYVSPENGGRLDEKLLVLSGVSFSVEENEFVSILGPSGCGKSTLLRLLAGLDREYEGSIRVNGTDLKEKRVPVCYMLQKDHLMPWRTLMENVLLPAEIEGADLKKEAELVRPMLKDFGLEEFENYRPHALSGGMRQRAALLRTYRMRGDIMLLDEPFGALDEITRMQMQDWLLEVWGRHRKTVLFVTHNIDEAILLSDRVLVMSPRPGSIVKDIRVGFPRPRSRDMLLSSQFLGYKGEILASLG